MSEEIIPLQEILEDDWFKKLPPILQEAVRNHPPNVYYWYKGRSECHIKGYCISDDVEFDDAKPEHIRLIITKTGRGHGFLASINQNDVFDVLPSDLHLTNDNPIFKKDA